MAEPAVGDSLTDKLGTMTFAEIRYTLSLLFDLYLAARGADSIAKCCVIKCIHVPPRNRKSLTKGMIASKEPVSLPRSQSDGALTRWRRIDLRLLSASAECRSNATVVVEADIVRNRTLC